MKRLGYIMRELAATLVDALHCADLPGHLDSWWGVARGAVRVD